MLPEVRMARIIDAIGLHQARKLSCVAAAELLGMSERHFRRLRGAYEAHGAEGIVDRRRGRVSGRRAGVDEIEWVIEAFRTRYFDFTPKHFHEAIQGRPMADGTPFSRGYTWTKSVLRLRGLVSKAPKRAAHRKKRARRPWPGMLVFQDGSRPAWLPQGPPLDLVVTLDDATSAILSAVLVEEEGTASSFIGLKETIAAHGLFSALYTDRPATTFTPPRPASRWTRPTSPRSGGRSSNSASSTSRATARRAGGAWSGCSARSRAACHRSCVRRGSPRSRPPTTGSPPSTSRTTTPVSRSRLPRKGRRSCRSWGRSMTSRASRRSAWWGTTTRSVTRAVCCRSPSSATAATSSRRTCAFTNTRTAGSRSSTVRCGSPTMSRTERWLTRSVRPEPLRKSASQQAYGRRGRALLTHPAHRPSAPERTFDVLRNPDIFTCSRQVHDGVV